MMHVALVLLRLVVMAFAPGQAPADDVAVPPHSPASPAAATLRNAVETHLEAGRIDEALSAAQRAWAAHPDDVAVRQEFVAIHLSLARRMIQRESFSTAIRALAAVTKVDATNAEARRLADALDRARRVAPDRVDAASDWLELEWFEPAFRAYGQAIALRPDRTDPWTPGHLAAAIGAGDDHYFCKNFHEAFYRYDAAIKLLDTTGEKPPADLVERWLQSMVHALSRDIDRVGYPPEYWGVVLGRIDHARPKQRVDPALAAMVRGLAYEDLKDWARAGEQYGRVLKQRVTGRDADAVGQARGRAVERIRAMYDVRLSGRRRGMWRRVGSGDRRILDAGRFRVHHHNQQVATIVAAAINFHVQRIARVLSMRPDEFDWSVPCDVFIHADAQALRAATGRSDHASASSRIRHRGGRLARHEIHLTQSDPLLLAASLPHEMAHIMIGHATAYRPLPGAIAEGLALHVEAACRNVQFARLFALSKRRRGVEDLLRSPQTHPPDPAFYAEAHRLVTVLLSRGAVDDLLDEAGSSRRLAQAFSFADVEALDRAYQGVGDGRAAAIN